MGLRLYHPSVFFHPQKNPEFFSSFQDLTDKNNLAALAASRPIIDSGWLPKQRQVGKSGLTVKPKLYMAVGISGAPEHLQGMKDAELIIAINSDAGAPIFEVADYGIVGDLFDIVPALSERLAEVRA